MPTHNHSKRTGFATYLPHEVYDRLKLYSKESGISMNQLVVNALDNLLPEKEEME